MENKGNNIYKILRSVLIVIGVLLITLFSVFCLKRFLKNSNVIEYDLSYFSIKEGFDGEISESGLVITPNDGSEIRDLCAESSYTLLDKGNYAVGLAYESSDYNVAYIQAGDSVYEEILLPAGEQTVFHNFTLDQSVEDARLRICFTGEGYINIKTMILQGENPLVSDWIVILGLGWGLIFVAFLYTKILLENRLTKQHIFEISFVIIVAFLSIPYLELINKGIFWGVDTNVQNMRIEGIKDALLGGQFPVVISPSMCNGYGSIEPMMYPSLFLYPFAILRILGVSPVMVYKMAHIIINIFMCSTCYVCVKKVTRSISASSIALVAFAFAKYHLTIVGAADSIYGMGIALIFMFLVLIGIYEIFLGEDAEWPYLTIGMWGVMNSHILSALFSAFLVGVFSIVFIRKAIAEQRIKSLLLAVGASVPICLYRIYTFLDAFINNDLNTEVLNIHVYDIFTYTQKTFFTDPHTFMIVILSFIGAIFIIMNKEKTYTKVFTVTSWGIMVLCMILASSFLPWETILSTKIGDLFFGYIQFPQRMLQIALPMCTLMVGMIVSDLSERSRFTYIIGMGVIIVTVLVSTITSYNSELVEMRKMGNSFSGKITGDVLSFPGMNDYVPDGENEESYSGRLPYYSSDNVSIEYNSYLKNGVNISCQVNCLEDNSYIDFPLFGYKGYVCQDTNGRKYKTGTGEHHRLRVFFDKSDAPIYINVDYKVPFIYYVLQLLSYASLFVLVTYNRAFLARTKKRVKYYEKLRVARDTIDRVANIRQQ